MPFPFAFHVRILFAALVDPVPVDSAIVAVSLESAFAAFASFVFAAFAGAFAHPGEELVLGVGLLFLLRRFIELDSLLSFPGLFLIFIDVKREGLIAPSFGAPSPV